MPSPERSPDSPRESAPRRMPRGRTIILAILAFGLLVRIALPFVLEWSLPRLAADQNLHVEIGNIDLGLVAGEITLEDLVVDLPTPAQGGEPTPTPDRDATAQPLLSVERIHLAFEWTGLLFGRLHITDLEIHRPILEVVELDDGSFALPVLPDDAPSETENPSDVADEAVENPDDIAGTDQGWTFLLDRFELIEPDLSLRRDSTHQVVVHLSAEELGFDALSAGADGIGLGGLDLEHPELFVERNWLLSRTASPPNPDTPPPPAAGSEPTSTGLPSVRMKHLKIQRAAFTVQTQKGPVAVALQFELNDVGTAPGQTFPVDLDLEIDDAKLGIEGRVGLNPVSFAGRVHWEDLSVPPFLLLAYPDLVPWLASCNASGDLEIEFASVAAANAEAMEIGQAGLTVVGSTGVSELVFKHPTTGELALEWDALTLDIDRAFVPLDPTPKHPIRVVLSRIALASPVVVYTNPPDALDELLAAMSGDTESDLPASTETASEAPATPGPTPDILIQRIELTNGTLRYQDRSVKPRHETKIHKLSIQVDDLDLADTTGVEALSVKGLIQSAGSFTLEGALPKGEGELDFALRELDLMSYASLARGAGWEIESGATSLDSNIITAGGGYKTRNKIVLHDLDVAPDDAGAFASQFGISIDLVLALLRDSSGDISLSVPVSVDNDGAGVDLGAIMLSALRNALQGAIASPMKMVGMLIPDGAPAESLGAIPFAPGETTPSDAAEVQLASLVEFVAERPMLGLVLHGGWSEDDRLPTARKVLEEKAVSGGDFPKVADATFFARRRIASALRARADGKQKELSPEDDALLERYVEAQEVSEDRLRSLADGRAESLRALVVERGASVEAISVGVSAAAEMPSVSIELEARRG